MGEDRLVLNRLDLHLSSAERHILYSVCVHAQCRVQYLQQRCLSTPVRAEEYVHVTIQLSSVPLGAPCKPFYLKFKDVRHFVTPRVRVRRTIGEDTPVKRYGGGACHPTLALRDDERAVSNPQVTHRSSVAPPGLEPGLS